MIIGKILLNHMKMVVLYGAVTHPALRILRKCENLICVQAGVCRLQRLMRKTNFSSVKKLFSHL
jgi:hypothetical protein